MGIGSIRIHLVMGMLCGLCLPLLALIIIKRFNLTFVLMPPPSISETALYQRKAGKL